MHKIKHLVITIHGVQTKRNKSNWQEEFENFVLYHSADCEVVNFKYGYWLGVLPWIATFPTPFLAKWLKNHYTKKFRKFIKKQVRKYKPEHLHLIGHSFGTWITHSILLDLQIPLQTVHLIAPVVSAHIKRNDLDSAVLDRKTNHVYIYSSKADEVCRLAPYPFGHLGYWGLIDRQQPQDRTQARKQPYLHLPLFNVVTQYEHGGYFNHEVFNEWLLHIISSY